MERIQRVKMFSSIDHNSYYNVCRGMESEINKFIFSEEKHNINVKSISIDHTENDYSQVVNMIASVIYEIDAD